MLTTRSLVAALSLSIPTAFASAGYVQLIDLPTLQSTGGGDVIASTIDGNQGYAIMNFAGGGAAQIVRIDDIGGANNVTTLTDMAAFSAAKGSAVTNLAGGIFDNGNSLYVTDIVNRAIWSISKANGSILELIDLTVKDPSAAPFFAKVDVDGDLVYYENRLDNLDKSTGFINGFNTILTDTELAAITGDDTPTGLGIDSNGVYYLGQSTSSAGENIYFYDPSDGSSGTFLTEDDVAGVGNDVSYSNTAFTAINDVIYARDGGTNDRFIAIDIATGTVSTIIDEADLLAGPAASDGAIDFSLFNGELAWTQISGGGSQQPGIYAIPEPASLALLGLGGLAMLRRRNG